ncbi:MAG TPA: zf-HC2 domain-containing protein [Actinomycetota bacterium]|nr:zf-HC2 domain-containing protein [Actinomycetota bacterium]
MKPELRCSEARVELSARMDGEIDGTSEALLDRHLLECDECRRHASDLQAVRSALRVVSAGDVPDLTAEIMRRVTESAPQLERRSRRWARARTGLVAAAATIALLLGVTAPWLERSGDIAGAKEIVGQMRSAARALSAYRAIYEITERGWHPDVGVRQFVAKLWFEAPEHYRMELRDHTTFAEPGTWPENDVDIVATPGRWWIREPAEGSERSLVRRIPFDGTTALPTDIILPLETLSGAGGFDVAGPQTVAGLSAYRVDLTYRTARPLVAALQAGGEWRQFHPLDRVRLWIDETTWFPLRFDVTAGDSPERRLWAEAMGLDDDPGDVLLEVRAKSFSTPDRIPPRRFSAPVSDTPADGGFSPGPESLFGAPGAPEYTADLQPYRPGTTRAGTVLTYSNGMTWLKVVLSDAASRPERLAAADPSIADEVDVADESVGYYRPSDETLRRQIDLFGRSSHVHLESNLGRAELMRVAASTGVRGRRVGPRAWGRAGTVRLDDLGWVREPGWLPAGYDASVPSAAVVSRRSQRIPTVVLYYRNPEAEFDGSGIRITGSKGATLPPSSELFVTDVTVDGIRARWSAERGELEWRDGAIYRAVRAPSFDLSVVLQIAEGLK